MDHLQFLISAGLVILLLALAGCTSAPGPAGSPAPSANITTPVEKVEVLHFHGNQQCDSCIVVGDLAEKTVNARFKDELASGRLVFAHVNYDLPENAALASKYGVTEPSLWIGIYDANGFHRQQNADVWSLTKDPGLYQDYLSAIIAKRLNGDLS